jgi:hypothetical protein
MATDQDNTGLSGVSVGSITNVENASASTTDYASINLTINLLATAKFAIKDQITNYPVGTYTAFERKYCFAKPCCFGNVTVRTYLDGVSSEEFTGTI